PGADDLFGACLSTGGRIVLGAAEQSGLYVLTSAGKVAAAQVPGAAGSCAWLDEERLVLDRAETHRLAIWRPDDKAKPADLGASAYLPAVGDALVAGTFPDAASGFSAARLWRLAGDRLHALVPLALPSVEAGAAADRVLLSSDGSWLVLAGSGPDTDEAWLAFFRIVGDDVQPAGRLELPEPMSALAVLDP
ncbi:MAG TPA: hypothetical protein VFW86_03605, partial [Candidatus Limnocylindrales bacterium]|nr:hypothetical protein [Candidatus Limnocylindrales bacterium]